MKDNKTYAAGLGKEPTDLKLLLLYFIKNVRFGIYLTIVFTVLFALVYYMKTFTLADQKQYTAKGELYLEYATDVRLDNVYINDYTWQNLAKTDKVTEYVLDRVSFSVTREELDAAVTAELVSDVRFVTITATMDEPEEAVELARLYQEAIIMMAEEMVDINNVVIYTDADNASAPEVENKVVSMAIVGAITGVILSVFLIIFLYLMDDSVYVPVSAERRFGIPVIGVVYRRKDKGNKTSNADWEADREWTEEEKREDWDLDAIKQNFKVLSRNCSNVAVTDASVHPVGEYPFDALLQVKFMLEQDETLQIARGDLEESAQHFSSLSYRLDKKDPISKNALVAEECAGYDGTVLLVRAGEHNFNEVERCINLLLKQGCNIVGILLYDADKWLLDAYYFTPVTPFRKKYKEEKSRNEEDENTDEKFYF